MSGARVKLTERQRDVLKGLASGHNTKEIADVLGVSPKTVEFHRVKMQTRLGLFNLADVTRYAVRVGYVQA